MCASPEQERPLTATITAFRVPPQQEFKAAKELRDNGHRAYLPTERQGKRKAPVARGYIFATGKPPEAKHVRQRIGDLPRASLIRLYPRRDRGHEAPDPFKVGDRVRLKYEVPGEGRPLLNGVLLKKRGRRQWLVDISGRQVCAQTTSLIRIDPG